MICCGLNLYEEVGRKANQCPQALHTMAAGVQELQPKRQVPIQLCSKQALTGLVPLLLQWSVC